MIEKILEFYKLQASGNDFILFDAMGYPRNSGRLVYSKIAKKVCQRKLGAGADGLLVIEPSSKALFKMRIFNSDGSEAEMCGNGARCVALWANLKSGLRSNKNQAIKFETKAGVIEAEIEAGKGKDLNSRKVKIRVVDPSDLRLGLPIKVLGRNMKVSFINTGVPHTVVLVQGLEKIDVKELGRAIRFHKKFQPAGTNVDFVEIESDDTIGIRTYERGVEDETLACGTGSAAGALISSYSLNPGNYSGKEFVNVRFKSGEIINVYFNRDNSKVNDVWLEGYAYLVYKGEIRI